jgi:hypothetical protein
MLRPFVGNVVKMCQHDSSRGKLMDNRRVVICFVDVIFDLSIVLVFSMVVLCEMYSVFFLYDILSSFFLLLSYILFCGWKSKIFDIFSSWIFRPDLVWLVLALSISVHIPSNVLSSGLLYWQRLICYFLRTWSDQYFVLLHDNMISSC